MKKIRDMVLDFNGINGKFKLKYACGYAFSKEFPSCNMMELLNVAVFLPQYIILLDIGLILELL